MPYILLGRPSAQARRSDSFISHLAPFLGYEAGWSNGEQAMFETAIARLTANAGFTVAMGRKPWNGCIIRAICAESKESIV